MLFIHSASSHNLPNYCAIQQVSCTRTTPTTYFERLCYESDEYRLQSDEYRLHEDLQSFLLIIERTRKANQPPVSRLSRLTLVKTSSSSLLLKWSWMSCLMQFLGWEEEERATKLTITFMHFLGACPLCLKVMEVRSSSNRGQVKGIRAICPTPHFSWLLYLYLLLTCANLFKLELIHSLVFGICEVYYVDGSTLKPHYEYSGNLSVK